MLERYAAEKAVLQIISQTSKERVMQMARAGKTDAQIAEVFLLEARREIRGNLFTSVGILVAGIVISLIIYFAC